MSDGEVPRRDEIDRLLEGVPGDEPADLCDRALLVALFGDGRTIADVLALTAYEAEWEDFAPGYREVVDAWLAERERLGLERFGPVFSSLEGEALTAPYVRGLVSRARGDADTLPDAGVPGQAAPPVSPVGAEAASEPKPPAPEPQLAPPPPPPRRGLFADRTPLAIATIALGVLLLAGGGIAAAVAMTQDSNGSTTNAASGGANGDTGTTRATSMATPSTSTRSRTTTAPPPAARTLVFVPGQSYCQLQAQNQLGFWVTLQNTGNEDITGVDLVAVETYGGEAHVNQKIPGLTVPAKQPKLQTVVSYPLPAAAKVEACSIKIFSPAFDRSGKTLEIQLRA